MIGELFGMRADLLIPLLAGHLLGDFVLQPGWMVEEKSEKWGVLLFVFDQTAHIVVIAFIAWAAEAFPWSLRTVSGEALWYAAFGDLWYRLLVGLSGWVLGAIAAGHLLGLLLRRFEDQLSDEQRGGLERGGFWMGITERSVIYMFMLVGEPTGIGFLAAAKSMVAGLLARTALDGLP